MNPTEAKQIVENFTTSMTGMVDFIKYSTENALKSLPKEDAEKLAEEMKKVNVDGKISELRQHLGAFNNINTTL
jgi:hypothetical protein